MPASAGTFPAPLLPHQGAVVIRSTRLTQRARLLLGGLALALVLAAWAAPAQAFNCGSGQRFALRSSRATVTYVTAEVGFGGDWSGMLGARSTTISSTRQQFRCVSASDGTVGIQSVANGLWVSAEFGR